MLTIKLILNDVVEDFEQEENEVVVGRAGVQEPRRAERLQQVQQLRARYHAQRLQVRRHCNHVSVLSI